MPTMIEDYSYLKASKPTKEDITWGPEINETHVDILPPCTPSPSPPPPLEEDDEAPDDIFCMLKDIDEEDQLVSSVFEKDNLNGGPRTVLPRIIVDESRSPGRTTSEVLSFDSLLPEPKRHIRRVTTVSPTLSDPGQGRQTFPFHHQQHRPPYFPHKQQQGPKQYRQHLQRHLHQRHQQEQEFQFLLQRLRACMRASSHSRQLLVRHNIIRRTNDQAMKMFSKVNQSRNNLLSFVASQQRPPDQVTS